MITKEDENRIAAEAALIPDQPLTNRAFLLGVAHLCYSIRLLRIDHRINADDFPDAPLDIFDELTEQCTKEFTIDEERKIDPELNRCP